MSQGHETTSDCRQPGPRGLEQSSVQDAHSIALLGDVGGHVTCLIAALRRLGVEPGRRELPVGLVVVQVGDLIGGPDDAAVVRLVDELMEANPGRWLQLVGNWEGRHVGGRWFEARREVRPLDDASAARLLEWVDRGEMFAAVALDTTRGPVLVTHAGLTLGFWRTMLRCQPDPALVARSLNAALVDAPSLVLDEGGPAWAWSTEELYPSWLGCGAPVPFGQIHGHSSPYFYGGHGVTRNCLPEIRERLQVDTRRRRCWLDIGGRRFVAVDPGIGRRPRGTELWPLVLQGRVTVNITTPPSASGTAAR